MQSVLEFDSTISKTQHRSRPIKACQSCRTRRVKCDCIRPECSECRKRQFPCVYQRNSPRPIPLEPDIPLSRDLEQINDESLEPISVVQHTTKDPEAPIDYCQYIGDTISMLANAKDTNNAEIELIRQFDSQMSRLNLGDLAAEDFLPILASLPAHEHCIRLCKVFEACVHPVVPICHISSLRQTLTGFWADNSFTTSVDTVALILSVIYAALISSPDKQGIQVAMSVYKSYDALLRKLDFPNEISKATVPLLQSYLLVHTCRASQIEPLLSFWFLPPAVRVAQSLKLHMESKFGGGIEAEVRRRIWWHLIYLDIEATLVSGLPILIHEDDYSTQMPCHLDDDLIMDKLNMLSHPFKVSSPMMISMQGRWHWAYRTRIWRRQKPTTNELDEFKRLIATLSHELEQAQQDLWARSYLQLQYDRAIVSAARGFMNGKSIGDVDCDHQVLRACRSFLMEYISLSELSNDRGIQWFIPGFVHPLQAVMILLLHLTSCPALVYEEQLRSKHLLEQSFDLEEIGLQQRQPSSEVHTANPPSLSKKANLFYCLLMKLRQRVWQRAKWTSPRCHRSYECALRDPTDVFENAHPDVERQQRNQAFFTTGREVVQHSFHPEDAMVSEPSETMEFHEYDDILEHFLLPGAMG